jgi:uncharacterized protein (TIGR00251 family)
VTGTGGPVATLSVRVAPRSPRDAVAGFHEGVVRIRLCAPPVEGRANEALIRFLARALGIPQRRVSIVSGESGRNKIVRVAGITLPEVLRALGLGVPAE